MSEKNFLASLLDNLPIGGLLGNLLHSASDPEPADETVEEHVVDVDTWAEGAEAFIHNMMFGDALSGKGSYFGPYPTSGTLGNAQASSLAERVAFDYSNMLKLSESGRVSLQNGQLQTQCVSNFYFDSTGNLTIGYGTNLEAHPDLLDKLVVINNRTGKELTLAEKQDYVRRLKEQYAAMGSPRNMTEAQYARQSVFNECTVTEASATAAMQGEVQMHLNELLADFQKHGVDPATIDHNMLKLALDIKYNVGGQLSKKYPTLFKKICEGNYEAITPADYFVCTSKTNKNACNKARENMKGALVQQAQLVQKAMRQYPLPANASAEELAAYKQQLFQIVIGPTINLYRYVPNGQILLPDAARSMALSIETALHGPLNVQQMVNAVQTADNALAMNGIPVNSGNTQGTAGGTQRA